MVKCPYCHHENQEGTLYCEQCKSDLAAAEAPVPVEGIPVANVVEGIPFASESPAESAPVAAFAEAAPVEAEPVMEGAPETHQRESVEESQLAPAAPAAGEKLAPDAKPRLVVLRGLKINAEYPIYEGLNFIGRADEKPVDIDLEDQEPPDRIWSSRQHAVVTYEDGSLTIEDLNSSNGTFVNRSRIHPGQKCPLKANDVVQIGTVQMKVKV